MAIRTANGRVRLRNGVLALAVAGTSSAPVTGGAAATALQLVDVTPDRIYQRVATSKAVQVNFTFAGSPSAIQARAVSDANTNTEIVPWTTIAQNPQGTSGSGLLTVPQGSWYRLQVRDSVNTSLVSNGANKFAVGALVALIGQSNMYHMWQLCQWYILADLRTRQYAGGKWDYVANVFTDGSHPAGSTAYGPAPNYGGGYTSPSAMQGDGMTMFANQLTAALGVPVGVLPYAATGSSIDGDWLTTGTSNAYTTFMSALTTAGGDIELAIWDQGEQNSTMARATYQGYEATLMTAIRSSTGRSPSNFSWGVVSLGPTTNYGPEGSFGAMRLTQIDFANKTPGAYYGGNQVDGDLAGDQVHTVAASMRQFGARYAKGYAAHLAGADRPGPTILSATRSGLRVDIKIKHSGGTALKDGAGGTGASMLGPRFYDAGAGGAQIAFTPIGVTASDTISVTLASAPVGALTMDFALANAPYGTSLSPANVIYDNTVVPGDTVGLPILPCAPIAVS